MPATSMPQAWSKAMKPTLALASQTTKEPSLSCSRSMPHTSMPRMLDTSVASCFPCSLSGHIIPTPPNAERDMGLINTLSNLPPHRSTSQTEPVCALTLKKSHQLDAGTVALHATIGGAAEHRADDTSAHQNHPDITAVRLFDVLLKQVGRIVAD
ncbi:hypothetical protein EYF80_002094 [Liparis tanakae]|uniref:Uncharacterized protein n=1 Tax=Liparis tanakae TaxID=230148 RepID=A0A4Z2JCM4_9TELE|nr:hypothetical protein EYF80_002094 [Liparis tanakae]